MAAEKGQFGFGFRSQLSKGNLFLGHDYCGQYTANCHESKQEETEMPGKQRQYQFSRIQISGRIPNSLKECEVLEV